MNILRESKVAKRIFLMAFAMLVVAISFVFSGERILAAEDDNVYIPDANFKALLNRNLGVKDKTADITEEQMATIKTLQICVEDNITDITGIEYCTNLNKLYLGEYFTNDYIELDSLYIENLSKLCNIESLFIWKVKSPDYLFISKYRALEYIYLFDSNITVLPDMSKCTNLKDVTISTCVELTDISGFSGLTNIEYLDLCDSYNISDIYALKGMEALTYLNLRQIEFTDDNDEKNMDTISSLVNIKTLDLSYCEIGDKHTSMFDNLIKLEELNLEGNNIYDINFLLKHKERLSTVLLYNNELSNEDTEVIGKLTNVIRLSIGFNEITDYSFISKLPKFRGGEFGDSEWSESSVTRVIDINLYNPLDAETYIIKNDVKDVYGNYVEPLESELYTYNEETKEITILTDKLDSDGEGYIIYEFVTNTVSGDELYINITKRLKSVQVTVEDILTTLGKTVTISMGISADDDTEFKWYKDGKLIEGASNSSLVIENIQLSDEGKYKLVFENKYSIVTFKEIVVTVKSYKELSGNLIISEASDNMLAYVGDKITYMVTAEGGSGNYKYDYIYNYGKGKYTWSNSSENIKEIECYKAGDINLYAYVYDSDGNKAVTNTVTITVLDYDKLEGTLELSELYDNNKIYYMEPVTYTVTATGGSGEYTYKYVSENLDTGAITVHKDNHYSSVYRTRLASVGKNKLTAYVIDSNGKIAETNSVIVTVYPKLEVSMKIDGISEELIGTVGDAIKLNATATGGSGEYTYKYVVENVTDKINATLKGYSIANSYSSKFISKGIKIFKVYVKDSYGNEAVSNSVTVTVYDKLNVTAESSLNVAMVGGKITFKATANGGSGNYTYSFIVHNKDTNEWARIKDNITSNTYTWTAISEGNRVFYVDVKDGTGKVVRSNALNVKTTPKVLELSVTAKTTLTELKVGEKLTLTATATGGSGKYTYSFIVYNKDTKKWSRIKDNITSNTYTWTATSEGNRVFYVDVKDSTGKVVRSSAISVKTTPKVHELSVTAKTTLTELKVGEKLTLTATATGGSGTYTYSVIVYNKDTKKWARLADNITSNTYTWKAKTTGNRVFYVDVKDSTGKIVRSEKVNVIVK